jgi:MFS family permease
LTTLLYPLTIRQDSILRLLFMKIIVFITLSIIAYYVSTDIYTPSMPTIATDFQCHRDIVQKTLSSFLIGSVLSCLFSGALADRYGNRKVILLGLTVTLIGSILAVFSTNIDQLIFARFLQGLGGVVAKIVGLSIVHNYTTEAKATRLFGIMGIYFAVVPAVAPTLGGFLNDHLGWRSNFCVLFILFLFAFIGIFKVVPKDNPTCPGETQPLFCFHDYYSMLKHWPFMAIVLITPFFVSGEWFMISFLPFYFQQVLGYTPEFYGIFLGCLIPWYASGSYLAGRYAERFGLNTLIYVALALGISASIFLLIIAFFMPGAIAWIYTALALYLVGFGILFPTTTTRTFGYFPELKATVSGLRTLCGTLFAFMGAQFAEILDETKFIHFALFFCSFSMGAFLLFKYRGEKGS